VKRNYDPACETLAEHFLGPRVRDALKRALAQHIQNAIEDWEDAHREEIVLGGGGPA